MENIYSAEIRRFSGSDKQTLGKFICFKNEIAFWDCCTLELCWKNNKQMISCIPAGEYDVEKCEPTKNIPYPHFWIKNVVSRYGIKIHILNFYTQIGGCVGVGTTHTDINGDGYRDITNSKNTLEHLLKIMPKKFQLNILDNHKIEV